MLRALVILTWIVAVGSSASVAQEVNGFAELFWTRSDLETERDGLPNTALESSAFRQRYRLDFNWRLYPNVTFSVGGLFEQDDTKSDGANLVSEATLRRLRPYISLRQNSRLFFSSLDLNRLQDTTTVFGQSSAETQDNYNAVLGWRPEDYPSLSFRFQRTDNYDSTRRELDLTRDLAEFRLQYLAFDKVRVNYRTGQDDSENHLEGNEIRRKYHTGNVSYGDQYLNRRIQFSADYDFDIQDSKISTSGSGEIGTQIRADEGLSELTEFPDMGVLLPNPELIDENLTASAGINLGLPPPGGDERPRNIGLDLGEPTPLNSLRVWVDTDLPRVISSSFVWDIYTSSDNLEWTLRQTVAPASFGTLETRFDLRIADLTARYVKAVTRPLSQFVPGADQFPDIFVTELEVFLWTPASEVANEFGSTTQRFTTDVRARLLRDKNLFYEFSYAARDTENRPVLWTMSNGLSFNQRLSRTFTFATRAARVDNVELDERLTAYIYSASLRAAAVPTLTQTLIFSGRWNDVDIGSDYTNSVFLYNGLQIYRGVTTNIGLGTAVSKRPAGERIENRQINATANLAPHRTFSANLQYQLTREDRSGGSFVTPRKTNRGISSVSIAYTPLPAIYLFGSYRLEHRSDGPNLTTRNYSLSWNPFAGGNLQLTFRYNETYRDELSTLFRFFTTRARWNITNRWFVELAWEDSITKSDLVKSYSDVLRAGTRLVF